MRICINLFQSFVVLALSLILVTAQRQIAEKCFVPIDLVFALDASGSVKKPGFEEIKTFTKSLVDGFSFGVRDTHVGVVTFSEVGEVQIGLTDTFDKTELFRKIDDLKYDGYRTNTNDALEVVSRDMFSMSGGTRQGVSKVLILLTDGKCTLCGNKGVETSANKLKSEGVTIFTIGVTDSINRQELEQISSDPSEKHMFFVKNFEELRTSIGGLQERSCTVKKGKCMKPPEDPQCGNNIRRDQCQTDDQCPDIQKCCYDGCEMSCKYPLLHCQTSIDIAFAIDSSSSVRALGFGRMKNFAGRIAESFAVSQTEARFATLIYSREAEVKFKFERYDTADQVINAIADLPHTRSDTRIDKALKVAKSDLFSLDGKVRTRRPMVLIVFFDGDVSRDMTDLEELAAPLKNYGVKIVAIGVGSEVNIYQIKKVATAPDMIYDASTFNSLMPKLFNIAKETCNKKFGQCTPDPNPLEGDVCRGIENECENDFDCFGSSKCCRRGCKNVCVKPPNVCLRKVDIAFAVDNNMDFDDFLATKYYIKNVVDQFEVAEGKTHISVMRFGDDAKVEFDFNSDQSSNEIVKSRIDALRYQKGRGRLSDVLGLACDAIFCQLGGSRDTFHKMMVLITGPTTETDPAKLDEKIRILRNRGVDILVIGVGNVDTAMLQKITDDNVSVDDRVLLARDYAGIVQYVRDIPDFACGAKATIPKSDSVTECKPKGCVKGEKGGRGRQGDVGPQGYDGDRGPPGPKGLQGPKGGVGEDGPMGIKGIRGNPGLIGLPGFTGYNGIPGVPGEIGPPGFDGGCGLPGQPGEAGDAGSDGFIGPVGDMGQSGFKGQKGFPARFDPNMEVFPGEKGDRGEPARSGRKGQKGAEGNRVFDGDLGTPGRQGSRGDVGEMGDYGKFIYRKGSRGDQGEPGPRGGHIIEVNEKLVKGGIKGEKGDDGDDGEKGNLGFRGIASSDEGRKGQQGPQGQQGFKGYRGMVGFQGPPGLFGEKGLPGDKGYRGIEGREGRQGTEGQKGEPGVDGFKGRKGSLGDEVAPEAGTAGRKGELGDEGFPGREGPPGYRGPKGAKGNEGDMLIGPAGDPGSIGLRGRRGDDGLPGIVGMEGFRGTRGPKGNVGQNGDQGLHGKKLPGRPGRDGPPGPKGDTGPIGNTGPPGIRGDPVVVDCEESICPKGRKGQIGAPGNTGDPGQPGPIGFDGLKGYPGGPCPLCPPGSQGSSGEPGNPGTIGANGEKGSRGDIGNIGEKGAKGVSGLDGGDGPKGNKGQRGDEGFIGEPGEDSLGVGIALKGFKGSSGSPGATGFRGPMGLKGRKGIRGPAGPQGSRGQRGIKGVSGRTGIRGFNGDPGRPGEPGVLGDAGAGYPGIPGNIGRQGQQGPVGDEGLTGYKGLRGSRPTPDELRELRAKMADFVGVKGPSGVPGEPGLKGDVGPEGYLGPDGERGPKGLKGYGGPKGNIGAKGRAGDDGDPGSAGFPGRNGQRGPPGDPGKAGKRGEAPKGYKGESGLPGIDGNKGTDANPTMGCVDFGDPTDIAFIMDSSRSVTGQDFDRQKEFIKNFLKRFPIGAQQTQAGIIKYGRTADIEIQFNDYTTENELGNAIGRIQHAEARESRLDLAFRVARDQLFTAAKGSRGQRVNKALVLLGDGFISGGSEKAATLQRNAKKYAEDLKQEGVTIFALGVGAERNKYLLREIVSDDSYYLEIESYSDLLTRIYEVQNDLQDTCTYVGEPGRDGLPGQPGDYGDRGEKGRDGSRPAGLPGLPGPKGFKGEPGYGVRGKPGVDGIIGRLGQKGQAGRPGRDQYGERGPKGYKGERSDIVRGAKGETGDAGLIGPVGPKSQSLCDNVLATDMVFVLDTSSSVGHSNFHKMKRFVQDIVRSFDVDNQLTRVSIITFDETALLQIPLDRHNSLNPLLENIDRLRYGNGQATRTDKALLLAVNAGFAERNGARDGVNKALIFMTDGQQSYAPDQTEIADVVRQMDNARIFRYAIGIGREIASNELFTIASNNVVYAENFDQLRLKINDQIGIIARRGCQGEPGLPGRDGPDGRDGFTGRDGLPGLRGKKGDKGLEGFKGYKGPPGDSIGRGSKGEKGDSGDPGPQGLPGCDPGHLVGGTDVVTDVVFMLDASGSLYPDGFRREKEFVKNVIDKMGEISYEGTHIGIIVYSDEANIRIRLNDHYSNYDLKRAIDDIPYDSQGTRIDLGFKEAKKMFDDDTDHGARGNSKKVLILLTDGQQTYVPRVTEPSVVAKELVADGIDIFAIGIGPEIDRVELESFISKPEYLFLAPEIDKIVSAVSEEITTALKCEGGPRGPNGRAGDDGPPGAVGKPGRLGRSGPKGERGEPGLGLKGNRGEPGIGGLLGTKGEPGFRGPNGPEGDVGLRGLKGYPGNPGRKGDPGLPGFVGNEGLPGPDGERGEQGESVGFGNRGRKGISGDPGRRGPPGDIGVLPLGNVIEDYKGPKGVMGPKGFPGGPGLPGQLLVAPGPSGDSGPPGEDGDRGEFGLRGQQGDPGPDGRKGITGNPGLIGPAGLPGRPGTPGIDGGKGERGFRGRTRKGERGPPGPIGKKGEIGPYGEKGFPGFIGMPGRRGDQGEPGFPGITPKPKDLQPPKGVKGRKGEVGDIGAPGFKGDRAPLIAGDDKGQKGFRGDIGDRGEKGFRGLGRKGRDGFEGPPGFKGTKGIMGNQGPRGKPGAVGQIIGIEPGDVGNFGLKGLRGRPGIPGIKGLKGRAGRGGSPGFKGLKGGPGFPGLRGDQGPPGRPGPKSGRGDVGKTGTPGEPGVPGPSGIAEGFYIVVHSQDPSVPSCPDPRYRKMWEGYSLMYTVGNGKSHSQDLGDPGSCVKSFSTMPFLFCDRYDSCKYASRNDFVYWLAGDVTQPMMPVSNTAIEPFISRCVVCEAPSIHIAVHSQDTSRPECPRGWDPLWRGYSFMMVAGAGKTGAGQSLSSSGSCLKQFRPKPFIECQGARGTCHFFSDKYSFWLTTIERRNMFITQQPQTLIKDKGDDLKSRVSRCRVCIRANGRNGRGDPPDGNTNNRRK